MPDGEVLFGKWSAMRNESVSTGVGSSTATGGGATVAAFGNSTSYTTGGQGYAYAILKSTKPESKLIMEFSAQFDAIHGNGGFGEAKSNDGRQWKVTF